MLNRKGFTLTELLVVVAILGIITGISIPLIRNLSDTFEKKKYSNYADSVLSAAKLYNDSYSEDLFGHKEYGCAYIKYSDLVERDLIKDIQIKGISCNSEDTYVRIIKQKDKYGYANYLSCGKEVNGKASNVTTSIPLVIPEKDETSCSGTADNNLLITATPNASEGFNKKKKTVKLNITSGTGINNTIVIYTLWSKDTSVDSKVTDWKKTTFKVKGNQEQKLLNGELISTTSNEIMTPDLSGSFHLLVRVDNLEDLYGSKWKNPKNPNSNIIDFGPFDVDKEAPTIPTLKGYKKTNDNDVTSVNGLQEIASDTWYNGWLALSASGSSDNLGAVTYYYTVTGASSNVTDNPSSTGVRNVNAEGESTIKVKACDEAKNCSSVVEYKAKLDRTKPTITANVYKANSGVTGKTGSSLASKTVNNSSSTGTISSASVTGNTNGWFGTSYPGLWYDYSFSDNLALSVSEWAWNASGLANNASGYTTLGTPTTKNLSGISGTESHSLSAEGHRYARFTVKDEAGNTSYINVEAKLDRTAPTIPTLKGYKKTNDNDVTSVNGLQEIASDTWYNGWIAVNSSGSNDSLGAVTYYYTVTGASSNVTNNPRSTGVRNVNAEGESTIKVKACDDANNCSSVVEYKAKLDRTKPTITANVYKANSRVTGKTGSSLASKTVNNSSSTGTISSASVTGNTNGWFGTSYPGLWYDYSFSDNLALSVSEWAWNASGLANNASGYTTLGTPTTKNLSGTSGTESHSISAEGHRYARFTVKDKAGNTSYINVEAKLDRTAPTCGTATNASTSWTKNARTIKQACNDTYSQCVKSSYDTTYSSTTKTASVTIADKAGNTRSCTYNVYIDTNSPTCSTGGGRSTWGNRNVTLTGICSDTGGSGCSNISKTVTASNVEVAKVTYEAHEQDLGWMGVVSNGDVGGITGHAKRIEAIAIAVTTPGYSCGVRYKPHIANFGWDGWTVNGNIAGTTGQSRSLEAIQIELTGDCASKFDILYRAHVADVGWMSWVSNGATAGTTGQSKNMEAIQIYLSPKSNNGDYQLLNYTPVKKISPGTVTDGAGNTANCPVVTAAVDDASGPTLQKITNTSGNGSLTCGEVGVGVTALDSKSGVQKYQISTNNSTWSDINVVQNAPHTVKQNNTLYYRACDYTGNCGGSASTYVHIGEYSPASSTTTCNTQNCGSSYSCTKEKDTVKTVQFTWRDTNACSGCGGAYCRWLTGTGSKCMTLEGWCQARYNGWISSCNYNAKACFCNYRTKEKYNTTCYSNSACDVCSNEESGATCHD